MGMRVRVVFRGARRLAAPQSRSTFFETNKTAKLKGMSSLLRLPRSHHLATTSLSRVALARRAASTVETERSRDEDDDGERFDKGDSGRAEAAVVTFQSWMKDTGHSFKDPKEGQTNWLGLDRVSRCH